jgi:hypothetical protein
MGSFYNHFNRAVAFADLWEYGAFIALSGLGVFIMCHGVAKLIITLKIVKNGSH